MGKFTVCFISDRHGNAETREVCIPDAVPANSVKMAIKYQLQANGFPEARDVVIMRNATSFSAVECGGLPEGVYTIAAGY